LALGKTYRFSKSKAKNRTKKLFLCWVMWETREITSGVGAERKLDSTAREIFRRSFCKILGVSDDFNRWLRGLDFVIILPDPSKYL